MNSETCKFYLTNLRDGPVQIVVGTVVFENGKLRFFAKKGYKTFMKNIRGSKTLANGKELDPVKDPEGWFRRLPYEYHGSMLRAEIVKTRDKKKRIPKMTPPKKHR